MAHVRIHQAGQNVQREQRCAHCQRVLIDNPTWRKWPPGQTVVEVLQDGQPLDPPMFYVLSQSEAVPTCTTALEFLARAA